ncbi:RsmD family RNA methyltransferase [Sunxiuqinia dokdonensis]|uniref:23S rRNA (Guanine1835-N2)-methyltransferase n=1 Tax=Sunxiuqinia dokdonensis TaxID=1409788 RepID=A0A0L8VA02_9BACT|nr:RsmD family RNA methyltransferase [Sunxiuqinia dokdonensis]KOH45173.1 23S rRNA (guanine1835-N2)-methyltransferase [Sunxiuqinia dokdonensis]
MRIVGGIHRGRQFSPGKNFKARPTTDMAKESLFNILTNQVDFEEIKILDLFAGTGSISFEFLSRGCTDITTIEFNYQHHQFIRSVVQKLNATKEIRAIKGNAFSYCEQTTEKFDVIFADPPYDHPRFKEVPALIFNNELLNENGLFILEHSKYFDFSEMKEFQESRHYGSVHFSFFR